MKRAAAAAAALAGSLLAAPAVPAAEDLLRLPIGDPARRDREVPVVLDAVTDAATGDLLALSELPRRLAGARLVLLGEEHTDADSHRVQLRVLEELHRAGRRLTIGLEMFPYSAQKALDDWTAGRLSEEAFLDASRWYASWGYNFLYYRDIFLFARDNRIPLLAINAPRESITAVRKKGWENLGPEEAAHVPKPADPANAEHLRLFKASFDDASFHAAMTDAGWLAMLEAQCAWDATMGFHAVQPLLGDPDPKSVVAVLVGSGHVQYGLGIERQARRWYAGKTASVIPVAVATREGPVRTVQASYASYVWGTPAETDPRYPELGVSTRARAEDNLLEVIHVEEDSTGARAGLQVGDVLVAMDGTPMSDREALARRMAGKRWGDEAVLTVRRGDKTVPVPVPLRRAAPKS